MPTTVTKSIGSAGGRDYSTIQAWEDALPANLVTGDTVQVGECYNDSEFVVAGTVLTIAGETTDATHTITLTTGAGQSFRDNANKQTNALRYNQSNGVGIRDTGNYTRTIISTAATNTFFVGLQIANTSTYGGALSGPVVVRYCILDVTFGFNGILAGTQLVTNCLITHRGSAETTHSVWLFDSYSDISGASCVNNTFVSSSATPPAGAIFETTFNTGTLNIKNCAFFGLPSLSTDNLSYTTCYTDKASPPTGCTTVNYDTSTGSGFQNITDATRDFRIKSGSAMLDVGTTDSTNAANDIVGTARPQGSAYDVGAWELVVAAASYIPFNPWPQAAPILAQ